RAWQSAVDDGHIDFGRLDEPAQESVIARVRRDKAAGRALRPASLAPLPSPTLIETNADIIRARYALPGYGERLARLYARLVSERPSEVADSADGAKLLDLFLAPERLTLLRT
ncbi:MAG: hypothetical protein K9M02_12950, partial [Thiohalocapsa sp.]|nr:hypothetical protein [Thiohalocapsa sp.]